MEKNDKRFVGAHLERDEYDRLKTLADAENRSVSNMIQVALKEYLEALQKVPS